MKKDSEEELFKYLDEAPPHTDNEAPDSVDTQEGAIPKKELNYLPENDQVPDTSRADKIAESWNPTEEEIAREAYPEKFYTYHYNREQHLRAERCNNELVSALTEIKGLEALSKSRSASSRNELKEIIKELSPAEQDVLRWTSYQIRKGHKKKSTHEVTRRVLLAFAYSRKDGGIEAFALELMHLFVLLTRKQPEKVGQYRAVLDAALQYCEMKRDKWSKREISEAYAGAEEYMKGWLAEVKYRDDIQKNPGEIGSQVFFHPVIHVSEDYAFFSFPVVVPGAKGKGIKTRLVAVDSRGSIFSTSKYAGQLSSNVSKVEESFASWDIHRSLPALHALRNTTSPEEAPICDLPSQGKAAMTRLVCWCLATYFFPRMEKFPILRVLVPSSHVAREVQYFIEKTAFLALGVFRDESKREAAKHHTTRFGTLIFGPERESEALPKGSAPYLEEIPGSFRRNPPVAIIEMKRSDKSPERKNWYLEVHLKDLPHIQIQDSLGYRLALSSQDLRQNDSFQDLMSGLSQLLFNRELPEQKEVEPPAKSTQSDDVQDIRAGAPEWIREVVRGIWKGCMEQSSETSGQAFHTCNSTCLMEHLEQVAHWFAEDGWTDKTVRRKLTALGVIEAKAYNLKGCLNPGDPAGLAGRNRSGMKVPAESIGRGVAGKGETSD